jgi:hypothetical protein
MSKPETKKKKGPGLKLEISSGHGLPEKEPGM